MPGIDRVEQRNAQIVDEAHRAERSGQLKAARKPEPGALIRRYAVEAAAIESDIAAVVAQRAAETVDEGALARPVGADQPQSFALGNGKIDAFERDEPAKMLA